MGARVFVGALLWLATAAVGAHADDQPTGPPPWRVGGSLGFTVDAASFPDSSGSALEVYLRLPPSTIATLERSEKDAVSRLRVTVRLRNKFGAFQHEATQEFTISPSDSEGFGRVVVLRFPTKSGGYRMEVKLEDVLSRKRGLAYIGRSVAKSTTVEGELSVPEATAGRRVSDLEFTWSKAGAQTLAFRHASADSGVLPNPDRLFGLLEDEVCAQFIAFSDDVPREWHWRARLLDAQGKALLQRDSTLAGSKELLQKVSMNVATQPAGVYELEVQVWRDQEISPVVRRGRFSVAWQQNSWWRNPRDVEDDVHFLLDGADDEEAFARMSPGEQEAFLEKYWRERDPTPSTAVNEARAEFTKRVQHANQTWTRSNLEKGMFTDMGRTYIRYGEPDEILRQVVPAGDQTLSQLVASIDASEDRPTGDVETKSAGGDMRPFEVWVYEVTRDRSTTKKSDDPKVGPSTRKRLLFLFVDEQGYGDYRLRYSTE
jgi:GWxTD domain-containing protein